MSIVLRAPGHERTGAPFRWAARNGLVVALAVALLVASGAAASSERTRTTLGVLGSADRFEQLTGQRSTVRHVILSWSQGAAIPHADRPAATGADARHQHRRDDHTTGHRPGAGRRLPRLSSTERSPSIGRLVYVRPLPEMNGHWNDYCGVQPRTARRAGRSTRPRRSARRSRASRCSPRAARRASSTPKLRRLGLPPARGDAPATQARIVWNPQGYGSPGHPCKRGAGVLPRRRVRRRRRERPLRPGFNAAWDANERLYAAHPDKPYAIAEWGLWGIDDPPSSSTWPRSSARTAVSRSSPTTAAGPARRGISRASRAAGRPIDGSSCPSADPLAEGEAGRHELGMAARRAEHVSDSSVLRAPPCSSALS